MGFGFLESVYQKCLMIELQKAGVKAEAQHPITVYYDYEDKVVGSLWRVVKAHEVHSVNYLLSCDKRGIYQKIR